MDLSLERIEEACRTVDPVFLRTPQYADVLLDAALGRHVVVKLETANPLRSFKGRGADFLMGRLAPGPTIVCSSTGNFGQAIAYAGRRRNRAVGVFVPVNVNPVKLARMRAFGARVTLAGHDSAAAEGAAREHVAATGDGIYVEDGRETAIAEGAGTIGVELLASGPFDAIVVPVGDDDLLQAMRLSLDTIGVVLEPSGAAGLAAIQRQLVAGERLATVLTGSNARPEHLPGPTVSS